MAILKRVSKVTGKTSGYQVLVDTYDVDNKRKRHVVGTYKTRKEAERKEREALRQRDTGTFVIPSELTVKELLELWLDGKRDSLTPNSHLDYKLAIDLHIVPAIGTVKVQQVTAALVKKHYGAWRKAGMSASMVRKCHTILSQALKQAVIDTIIYANPCDSVDLPKVGQGNSKAAGAWNQQEAMAFLHTATHRPIITRGGDTGKTRPDALHPLWHLLLLEGMRRGEALGLRWRDVDLDRGTVHIVQTIVPNKADKGKAIIQERTKTNAGARTVRLTNTTLGMLREHKDRQVFIRKAAGPTWQDHDLIICTATGTPVNPSNVSRNFDALVSATRLPDGTPLRKIRVHDMRHTAATMLLRAGTPAKIVSERLGHANINITLNLYSHVLPDMQAEAASAMDDLFSNVGATSGTAV